MQKKYVFYLIMIFFFSMSTCDAQIIDTTNFSIKGSRMYINSGTSIYIDGTINNFKASHPFSATTDGEILNNDTIYLAGNISNRILNKPLFLFGGTVSLRYNFVQYFRNDTLNFQNLVINKPTNKLILQRGITIGNQFRLVKGTADLVSYNIDLLNNGSLIGENFQNYIYSLQGYMIARNRLLSPANNGDISTFKLSLNPASDNLGLTTILRRNKVQDSLVDGSIERMYDVFPNTSGNTDVQFNYSDTEWQSLPISPNELNFRLFYSSVTGVAQSPQNTWRMDTLSVADAGINKVNSSDLFLRNTGTRLTVADKNCKTTLPVLSLPNAPVWMCITDSVILNAGGSATKYLWSTGETTQTIKIKAASISGASLIISVTGFNNKGCSSKSQVQLNVYPNPVPQFSIPVSVCKDISVVMNNTSSVSGGGSLTYNWKFHNGSSTTVQNPLFAFTSTGTFATKLIATTPYGCKDSLSKNIIIQAKPVASFSPSALESCEQKMITLSNSSSVSSGAIAQSSWTFGDGFTSSLFGGSALNSELKTYANVGNYSIKLKVRSSGNCFDSTLRSVVIHAKPIGVFTATGFTTNFPTVFSNTSSVASGYSLTHAWDLGDGTGISTDKDPIYTYTTSGIYSPELIVTTNKGCTDTVANAMVISGMPQVAFNFTSVGLCTYNTLQFNNLSTIDAGILNYGWDFGDGTSSTASNPTKKYTDAGTYIITLLATASSGLSNTSTQVVTIDPVPNASYIVNGVCLGFQNSFANTSTIASGSTTYLWDFGDGNTSVNNSINYTYITSGTYTTNLYATSDKGCKDTSSVSASVFPNPKANFTVSNACQGQVTGLVNASTIAGGTMSYFWSLGNSTTSSQANPTLTYAAANTYTVILNVNSDNGCSEQVQKSVQVYAVPVANFSASTACFKNQTNFTNQSTLLSGTLSYEWSFGFGSTSTGINPSIVFPNPNTFTVFLKASSNNNCSHTRSKLVSVRPLPQPNFTANSACEGQLTQFSNSSTIADVSANSALTYNWKLANGITSAAANPSRNYVNAGNYNVTLTATSVFGCQKDTIKNATVVSNPVIDVSAQNHCIGENAIFINLSSVVGSSLSYFWNFNDGTTSTAQVPSKIFNQAKTHITDLTATTTEGCVSTGSVSVIVSPTAVLSFNSPTTICANTAFNVINASSIASGTFSQIWSFGSQATSSLVNPSYAFNASGAYPITLKASSDKGCVSSLSSSIVVYDAPKADFSIAANANTGLLFTNLSTIAGGGTITYLWNFGDGKTSSAANTQNNYAFSGTYSVSLLAASPNGCSNSITKSTKFPYNNIADFEVSGGQCVGSVFKFIDKSIFSDPSLSYQWSFGDGNISTLKNPINTYSNAGSFTVTLIVTPSVGVSVSKSINVSIFAAPQINFTANNACLGNTVTLNNTSTDLSNVSFSWNLGDGSLATSQNTSRSYAVAGQYPIELHAVSAQGCSSKVSKSITVFSLPVLNFGDTLKTCGATFTLDAQNVGASYLWSTNENTQTITANNPGIYSVEVTNANGCKTTSLTFVKLNVPYQINLGADRTLCEQEKLDVGYAANLISWSDGSTDRYLVITTSGIYSVSGTDMNGCSSSDEVAITINTTPVVNLGIDKVVCQSIPLDAQNTGTTFSWSTNENTQIIIISQSGLYQVEATNSNGCKSSDVVNITVVSNPIVDLGADLSICGVDFPYTLAAPSNSNSYAWSTGNSGNSISITSAGLYAITATSGFGCKAVDNISFATKVDPLVNLGIDRGFCTGDSLALDAANVGAIFAWSVGKNTQSIVVKTAGQYCVRVTSANGCVATDEIIISENTNPFIGFVDTLKRCDNQLPLTIQSPNGFASYLWSNGSNTSAITVSNAGIYSLTVTDANLCKITDDVYVKIQSSPIVNLGSNFAFCQGQVQQLNAQNAGLNYLWSNNATSQIINVTVGGVYDVLVTNPNGCNSSSSITLAMKLNPVVNLGLDRTLCSGQNASLNAGNSGSTFNWSTGESTQTITAQIDVRYIVTVIGTNGCSNTDDVVVNIVDSPSKNLGNDITSCNAPVLDAGNIGSQYLWSNNALTRQITAANTATYIVQITNPNNCIARDTIDITIHPKPVLELGNDTSICAGQQILMDAQNFGSSYFWSNSAVTRTISVRQSGLYKTTVINSFQCSASDSIRVLVKANPIFDFGADRNFCLGGSVTLSTSLPVATNYLWSTGSTSNTLSVNTTTSIWLRATGTNGCIFRDTVGVFARPFPVISLGPDVTICGRVILDAKNIGSTYVWSNGVSSQTATINLSNNYNVKVTSPFGCVASDTVNIVVKSSPLVNLGTDIAACNGDVVTLFANTNAEKYKWNTNDTISVISVTGAGQYSLTAQNGNGCVSRDTIVVQFNSKPILNFKSEYPVCGGNSGLELDATNAGASYLWKSSNGFSSSQPKIKIIEGGIYTVTVTNSSGCFAKDTILANKTDFAVVAEFLAISSITSGDTVRMVNLSYPGEFSSTWDFGDGIVSNEVDPQHVYFISGEIPAKLTVSNGVCTDFKIKKMNIKARIGIEPKQKQEGSVFKEVKLYPNPNDGRFIVETVLSENQELFMEFYSLGGKLIDTRSLPMNEFHHSIYEFPELASGTYIIRVSAKNEHKFVKVLIIK